MTTTADNYGNKVDKVGIAPTFRWGIGTADEFSLGYYYLQNDNGINYGIPWLRKNDGAQPISESNPGVLVPIDPRNYYGAASDYNAGYASYGSFDYTHRFAGGGAWHTVLRHGGYDRDQRASAIRFCVRTATANLDCPAAQPSLATISDATPLTLGTNNKVQDLRSTYVQTDLSKAVTALGRTHELLAGVDLAREEFNNYTLTLPAGAVLNKNTPRTTIGSPNQGPSVDESLRQRVLNRNFVARALGVYVQDLVEIAPTWKLLAGLRWDRFEGSYFAPAAAPDLQRLGRTDSLLSERLGLLWQPSDTVSTYLSWGTSFNPSGELFLYDLPGSKAPPEKSRNLELGAKLDLFDGRLSTRVSLFHSIKTNERNRDSPTGQPLEDFLLSGRRHASGLELDLAGRITSAWEVYGSYAWIPSARIDKAAEFGTVTGELVGQRPSLTPRHSGTLFTTYQLTEAWRLGGGVNARGPQTPNRNPVGIVAPGFVTADLLAEYAFSPTIAVKMNLLNVANRLYADSLYTGHYVPGQPRTFSATLTARF
jgi:catecholate siderophore receptor